MPGIAAASAKFEAPAARISTHKECTMRCRLQQISISRKFITYGQWSRHTVPMEPCISTNGTNPLSETARFVFEIRLPDNHLHCVPALLCSLGTWRLCAFNVPWKGPGASLRRFIRFPTAGSGVRYLWSDYIAVKGHTSVTVFWWSTGGRDLGWVRLTWGELRVGRKWNGYTVAPSCHGLKVWTQIWLNVDHKRIFLWITRLNNIV